ncbi:MAG: ATP-binding protein [Candidatus Woesearchaeota archaeon]
MYEIVIGRNKADQEKYGQQGTVLIGKHYVKMGQVTSLSNQILFDVASSHVVFVCGKRGSGKSYTMGSIVEGMVALPKNISQNLAVIMLDTMGIYWTMKYPNQQDKQLLKEWGMEPKGLNVQIYTPIGYFQEFRDRGIPTDFPFSIKPSELAPEDWCSAFNMDINDPIGVLVVKTIAGLKKVQQDFAIQDIIDTLKKDEDAEKNLKEAAINHLTTAESWGLFSKQGTPIKELVNPGQITVLDVSCYATTAGSNFIRSLVIGLVAEKLFVERMIARRNEEYLAVHKSLSPFSDQDAAETHMPLVWLVIDEAHEFLPREGKTLASDPLITILREGRQPGISLILASQQPGKIHTDVMTQSDTVIAHRLTAKLDVEALGMLMQSYMQESLDKYLNDLPRVKGAAIVFDDTNERLYPMRVRPRITWHGGGAPVAVPEEKRVL